jgi:hypothetical protein
MKCCVLFVLLVIEEPFNVLASVQAVIPSSLETLNALEARIVEDKLNKTIQNKKEWASTLLGVARHNIDTEQWGQAAEKIETLRSVVAEMCEVFYLFYFIYLF